MSRLTLEAARAALVMDDPNLIFSISTTNELYPEFRSLGNLIFPIDTFRTGPDALLKTLRILQVRRKLINWLTEQDVESVVVLMPHVWTPLIADAIKRQGIHYAVVVHDAKPHPGDPTGLVTSWLLNDARAADTVFTLSPWVTRELIKQGTVPAERVKTLFMPDMMFSPAAFDPGAKRRRETGQPLRVLFFGRLLRYKGLHLFTDAMEVLAAEGIPLEISVCGEGDLSNEASRLARLGTIVVNRWLSDAEVGQLLTRHDLVVLTHIEASQSGVIAAALGAGVPVVTTPVGGLADQIQSRGAGLVSERIDAQAIADCIRALVLDCARYNGIVDRICSDRSYTVARLVRELVAALPSKRGSGRLAHSPGLAAVGPPAQH